MSATLWCFLTLAAFLILIALYQISMASLGRRFGIGVRVVSIGFGRAVWQWQGKHWKYQIGWIPFGGYTRFVGGPGDEIDSQTESIETQEQNDDSGDSFESEPGLPVLSYGDTPARQRLAILLPGPSLVFGLGLGLLAVPIWLGWNQLASVPLDQSRIKPTSIGGLESLGDSATLEGQYRLTSGTSCEMIIRTFTWGSLDGWGAFFGGCITGGYLGDRSWRDWITFLGLTAVFMGLINLLPIPAFNGGYVVFLLAEIVGAKKWSDRLQSTAMPFALVAVLVINVRWWCYDAVWLWRFLRA